MFKNFKFDIFFWAWSPYIKNWTYRNSCTNYWRLYHNRGNSQIEDAEGIIKRVPDNKLVLIPPLTRFSTSNKGTFAHLYLHFSAPPYFNRVRQQVYYLDSPNIASIPQLVSPHTPPEIRELLLIRLLIDAMLALPEDAYSAVEPKAPDPRIQQAIMFMKQNLSNPPDNRFLSRRIGLSVNSLQRLFLQEYGMPPQHYLRLLRVEEARKILQHTNKSIEQVASELGFADRYHFSKTFKRILMITPAACRKNHCQ